MRLNPRSILAFAAVVEVGTGLTVMIDPTILARLLLGVESSGAGTVLGRCFGIALLALGLACWPEKHAGTSFPALRAMSAYNSVIALYLGYLGVVGHGKGPLLWPVVALHAAVASLLVVTRRREASVRSRAS